MIPIISQITLEGRFTIVFSFSVILFSSAQYRWERRRNKINDLRNELETVYGPLFTLSLAYCDELEGLSEPPTLSQKQTDVLNLIFETYPHVLVTSKLYDHWKEFRRNYTYARAQGKHGFDVDIQFISDIMNEYNEKVKSYRNLVGKESTESKHKLRKTTMDFK